MTRKYRPDDADSSKEDRWVAILSVLQECWDDVRDQDAQSPNAIAQMIEGKGIIVHRPFGHSGKKLGGGSSISSRCRPSNAEVGFTGPVDLMVCPVWRTTSPAKVVMP